LLKTGFGLSSRRRKTPAVRRQHRMGDFISLTAADGHELKAWMAEPATPPKAGIVVLQEIFGVNSHIRDVAGRFAAQGYLAVAPAIFDRVQPGFECGYGTEDRQTAIGLMGKVQIDKALLDIDAALAKARTAGKVGVIGYCFGGLLTWLAAARLKPDAAIAYYAGRIDQFKEEQPNCPVMLHFGREDSHIPLSAVDAVHAAHPDLPLHLYDAGHGFSCDQRDSYNEAAHRLAWERSLGFFAGHLAR
jgi:carboxymethylenebutenolidase